MPKKEAKASPEKVALYEKLLATIPEIERKGAGLPYTAVNGNMFSMLTETGEVALRLPPEDIEPFLKKYNTTLQTSYGVVRKDYVMIPDSLLKNTKSAEKYLAASYEYAKNLKAKPTTKKK